jgi:hypothetical protein
MISSCSGGAVRPSGRRDVWMVDDTGGRHSSSATASVLARSVGQHMQGLGDAQDWDWPQD